MNTRRSTVRWAMAALVGLSLPAVGAGQTSTSAPLPAAAQAALDKGVMAATLPDYPLAIRLFQEARRSAPDAPVVYLNLGLAESKIPGRELRAIAWFGAYMAALPDAQNAAAVKKQIAVLDMKVQSNNLRLVKAFEDSISTGRVSGDTKPAYGDSYFARLTNHWVTAGDIAMALKTVDRMGDAAEKSEELRGIAKAQADSGDMSGARKTIERLPEGPLKSDTQAWLVSAQASSGDITGAQTTADQIQAAAHKDSARNKERARLYITYGQIDLGDIAGAEKTIELMQDAFYKTRGKEEIAKAKIGPPVKPQIRVSDWLKLLDDASDGGACALNTELFLDLAAYLKALPGIRYGLPTYVTDSTTGRYNPVPPSEDPKSIALGLSYTAARMLRAQVTVARMLKKQFDK